MNKNSMITESGYVEGAKALALWMDPSRGLDGRICALIELDGKVFAGDFTCATKMFSERKPDSLRKGWKFSKKIRSILSKEMKKELIKSNDSYDKRLLQKILNDEVVLDDYLSGFLYVLSGYQMIDACLMFKKPKTLHNGVDIGLTGRTNFYPNRKYMPPAVTALAKKHNAIFPKEHVRKKKIITHKSETQFVSTAIK